MLRNYGHAYLGQVITYFLSFPLLSNFCCGLIRISWPDLYLPKNSLLLVLREILIWVKIKENMEKVNFKRDFKEGTGQ